MKSIVFAKRLIAGAMCLIFFVAVFPEAMADTRVSVSFASANVSVAAGAKAMLDVVLSEAVEKPITVFVSNKESGAVSYVTVPVGSTAASVPVHAPHAVGDPADAYDIVPYDAYITGEIGACTVTAVELPVFTLGDGKNMVIGYPGKELNVGVYGPKSEYFKERVMLTLVSESGQELGSTLYRCGARDASIRFTFPEDTGEKTKLFLYAYGLTDECLASVNTVAVKAAYKGITGVDRDDGLVGLSFDCAYGEAYTDSIIDNLKKYNCTATFFMIGTWVSNHGPWIERIIAGGNEVGNHSMTHERMAKMAPAKVEEELLETEEMIVAITGTRPQLFRPPYGNGSPRLTAICHYFDYEVIYWTIDARDWDESYTPTKIANRVCDNVKSGDILLFHNGARHSAKYLPIVLQFLADNGLKGVRISDMLYKDNFYVDEDGRQHQNAQ